MRKLPQSMCRRMQQTSRDEQADSRMFPIVEVGTWALTESALQKLPNLDWTQRESVKANLRRKVRRLLALNGYPPHLSWT